MNQLRKNYLLIILLFVATTVTNALDKQPAADYHARREALAKSLNGGVAVLFAAQEPLLDFMPYRQDEDFYYLTGWNEPGAALLIQSEAPATADHAARSYREILFLPTRNLRAELYTGAKLDADSPNVVVEAGVAEILVMTELPSVLNKLSLADGRVRQNIWSQHDAPESKALLTWTAATLGSGNVPDAHNVADLIMKLRTVKDAGEIALLTKATDASMVAQRAMMRAVHPGASERSVAGIIIEKLMEQGCERVSYAPIVGSGLESTVLHYSENSQIMQKGDVVVVDAAGEYSMYASDITRTVPVSGHFSARQREVYEVVLGAQRAAMAAFVAGKSKINDRNHLDPDSLDTVAWNYINTHGKDLHGEPLGKYWIHGLGHSVGIDVHDPMDYTKPIPPGAVFTIEPGIYIPEEKLGVRIEDIYRVDESGRLVDLAAPLAHTADEVEAAMKATQ
jgi:Xaa-Pro aminopeptidase